MLAGAIIGFGAVAEKAHVPAWKRSSRFTIAAIADERGERRGLASRLFPDARIYASLEELLRAEKSLDFVDIATPPFLHERQILLALESGRHVLCEKPLVLEVGQLERIRAEAARRHLAVFPVHNWKYAPLFQKLRSLLRSGAIGSLRHAALDTLRSRPAASAGNSWRTDLRLSGGGILIDHGWHAFYLLNWLLEASPLSASAELEFPQNSRAEEEASCLLKYPGASASIFLTWRAAQRANRGIFYGDAGTIELADDRLVLVREGEQRESFLFSEPLSQGSAHPEWFHALLPDFEAAVAEPYGRDELAEARGCLTIIESLYRQRLPEPCCAP